MKKIGIGLIVIIGIGAFIYNQLQEGWECNSYKEEAKALMEVGSIDEAEKLLYNIEQVDESEGTEILNNIANIKEKKLKLNNKINGEEALEVIKVYAEENIKLKQGEDLEFSIVREEKKGSIDGENFIALNISKIIPNRDKHFKLDEFYITKSGIYFGENKEKVAKIELGKVISVNVERNKSYFLNGNKKENICFGKRDRFGLFEIKGEECFELCDKKHDQLIDRVYEYKQIEDCIYFIGDKYGYIKLNLKDEDFEHHKNLNNFSKKDRVTFRDLLLD